MTVRLCNVTVVATGEERVGLADADGVGILPTSWEGMPLATTDDLLRWYDRVGSWQAVAERLPAAERLQRLPWAAVRFLPAVRRPAKIFCIGLNYRRHAQETGKAIPSAPEVFSKFSNALAGHREVVAIPPATTQLDYEAELVMVIGRRTYRTTPEQALAAVGAYTAGNDLSARDLQHRTSQWLLGKSCDGFAPLGPWLVTGDAVPDPDRLAITLERNGTVAQSSNTADMIFSCRQIVAYLSQVWTLEPGDVIFTGTPEGVILGQPPERQRWLAPGETTVVRIEGIGELVTTFASA